VLRRVGSVAVVALAAFHLWLFGGAIADGRLASPELTLRWALALALFGALLAVGRTSDGATRRRRLIALWTLAALLHIPAAGDRIQTFDSTGPPLVAVLTGVAPLLAFAIAALFLLTGFVPSADPTFTPRSAGRRSLGRRGPSTAKDAPRPPPREPIPFSF
jgi:hypothetical protein